MSFRRLMTGAMDSLPGAAPLSRTFGSAGTAGNTGSPNYGSLTAPNPATGRYLFAIIGIGNNARNNGVATCDIAGGSATMFHEYDDRPAGADGGTVSFWYRQVDTGSTATLTATFDTTPGNNRGSTGFLYEITGLTAAPTQFVTPVDESDANVNDKLDALAIAVAAGGLIFGASAQNGLGAGTWVGITEDAESNPASNVDLSVASDEFATAQTPTITFENTGAQFLIGSTVSIGPS